MAVADVPGPVARHLAALAPIGLADLQESAALHTRTDRKYIVQTSVAALLIEALGTDHRALQIEGRRSFEYRSAYFDSASLGAFRAHAQGRRNRYKCRTRHYVDSDQFVFEVKLKGRRGETIKHQLPCTADEYREVTPEARSFAAGLVRDAYGRELGAVHRTLETRYRRVTLAACDGSGRVTFDFDLGFGDVAARAPRIRDGFVVIETKSDRGLGRADRFLKGVGVRPVDCSKYCLGIGLMRHDVHAHHLRWVLRRYFAAGACAPTIGSALHG